MGDDAFMISTDKYHDHAIKGRTSRHGRPSAQGGSRFLLYVLLVVGIAIVLFSLVNVAQTQALSSVVKEKFAEAKEELRPADITLLVIDTECVECYDISQVVEMIKGMNGVHIVSEKHVTFGSSEADKAVKKYKVSKLPTVIVSGELEKAKTLMSRLSGSVDERSGALVLTKQTPPFVDARTGVVKGEVRATILAKDDCEECRDLSIIVTQLKQGGVFFTDVERVSINSDEGVRLVEQYNITKVPTILFSRDLEEYEAITQLWSQIGTEEDDGTYVMREVAPPYYDLHDQRLRGVVNAVYLVDESCEECYDAQEFHKTVLSRMGVVFGSETVVDAGSSRGQEFVRRYSIKEVPTVILTGDVELYAGLVAAWKNVGTVEDDGAYVFRAVSLPQQPYKNLETGEVIRVSQSP